MAISLHRSEKEKVELNFCVKKVIKLMKYLRDLKGGPMLKLWSHLLKVPSAPSPPQTQILLE